MITLLIAIYLANGSLIPSFDFRIETSYADCLDAKKKYLKEKVSGQAWAICAKPIGVAL